MRRSILCLLLLICSCSVWAQKLDVGVCYHDATDSTAIYMPQKDPYQPREFCAVLKVKMDFEEASFSSVGLVSQSREEDEYWIYLSHGTKKVTVQVPGFLPKEITFNDYGIETLEGLKVYRMSLGQKIVIDQCSPNSMDIEAYTKSRKDPTNASEYCALVKVQLVAKGATFEGNVVGDIDFNQNEYHVYMQKGSSELVVNVPGYLPCSINFKDFDINALEGQQVYKIVLEAPNIGATGPTTQDLKISVIPKNAELTIEGEKIILINGFASKRLPEGKYAYSVSAEGHTSISGNIHLYGPQDTLKIVLSKRVTTQSAQAAEGSSSKRAVEKSIYLGGNYQIGGLSGVGVSAGAYINGFNIQLDFLLGLQESEEIFWNGLSSDPYSYTYSPIYFGIKFGYGFKAGDHLRFTPQIGMGISKISGAVSHHGQGADPNITAMTVVPMSAGLRAEWLIAKHFGISFAPEYCIALQQGKPYEEVSAVSTTVKGFGQGLNLQAGLFICF